MLIEGILSAGRASVSLAAIAVSLEFILIGEDDNIAVLVLEL